ncbi:hypothetical protein BDW74DRAFT_174343 [Aspergillus multicolor]|uniref:putative PTR family peptide transporter n=1 Tax=Aspergillus multicolor TaxID=41759 RepID=UPI003CCD19B0
MSSTSKEESTGRDLELSPSLSRSSDNVPATEDEIPELQHVAARLPMRIWLAATIGMAERFTYYRTQTLFQNYLQNSLDDLILGALGLGKFRATTVNLAFTVAVNLLPLPISILVDGRLGRYRALQAFTLIYARGSAIPFGTSFPAVMKSNVALIGFILGAVLIAVGLGGVQASVQPSIADQRTEQVMRLRVRDGQRVVEDRELTIQYIYSVYYWMVNVGSLGSIATTSMEIYIGYWSAYLLDLCAVILTVIIVQSAKSKSVHPSTQGSVLPRAACCLWYAAREGFRLDAAQPNYQLKHKRVVPWDKEFITELREALSALKICIGWPIFWVCMGQRAQVSILQAGQMETHAIPNDLVKSSHPVAYVIIGFLVQKGLYPLFQCRKIIFSPVNRITLGFLIMSLAMAYAAIVQVSIYRSGPCYSHPLSLSCEASEGGTIPSRVHVLLQLPTYVIIALAEVFCWPTGSEYTYSHAPRSMKSILQACHISTAGIGYLLGMALSPLVRDPLLVVLWSVVAAMMFGTTVVFWIVFRKY